MAREEVPGICCVYVYICAYMLYICCLQICAAISLWGRPAAENSGICTLPAVSVNPAYVSTRQHTSAHVSICQPRTAGCASCSAVSIPTFVLVSKYFCTTKAISTCEKSGIFELLSRHYLYFCTSTASKLVRKERTFWPHATVFTVYIYT